MATLSSVPTINGIPIVPDHEAQVRDRLDLELRSLDLARIVAENLHGDAMEAYVEDRVDEDTVQELEDGVAETCITYLEHFMNSVVLRGVSQGKTPAQSRLIAQTAINLVLHQFERHPAPAMAQIAREAQYKLSVGAGRFTFQWTGRIEKGER